MTAFILWCVFGLGFIGLGIYCKFSKRQTAFPFWAGIKPSRVNDTVKYNSALGKLFIVFGIIMIFLGIPLLSGQNSPLGLITITGTALEAIAAMIVYSVTIEPKYCRKK